VRLLEQALAHPQRPLSHLDLLLPQEREQLLAWSTPSATQLAAELGREQRLAGSEPSLPHTAHTLVALFDAQVARTPHATALISGDERCSYAQLDAAANRLARYLIRQGLGPEDI